MILVFGETGQVGHELRQFQNVCTISRDHANLLMPMECADVIFNRSPKAVINAAAYTAVDQAETEEALAMIINGDAPTAMARACAELDIPLVHISTDYVFDGGGEEAWSPSHPTVPQSAYGRSKLAGEIGIRSSGAAHAIIRTSWAISSHGTNFVKTMLEISERNSSVKVVSDQIGGPTPAYDIAATCYKVAEQLIQNPSKSGTYHYSGSPDVSWAEFARLIFKQTGRSVVVRPIPSIEYSRSAKRPLNSRMNCSTTEKAFDISRPDWRIGLNKILSELGVCNDTA